MRSIPFTLLLLLATVGLSLTAAMRLSEGSLQRLFGPPATALRSTTCALSCESSGSPPISSMK